MPSLSPAELADATGLTNRAQSLYAWPGALSLRFSLPHGLPIKGAEINSSCLVQIPEHKALGLPWPLGPGMKSGAVPAGID